MSGNQRHDVASRFARYLACPKQGDEPSGMSMSGVDYLVLDELGGVETPATELGHDLSGGCPYPAWRQVENA